MPKLVAIQVLRGLAAIAIALFHFELEWRARGLVPTNWLRPFPLEAGVDVFFVISGFVMVYASDSLFGRPGAAGTFLSRRVARVVPLYWLTTLAFLLVQAIKPDLIRSEPASPFLAIASFLFIPWPRPGGLPQPIYSLGWTLNYEMFFYVLFAAALAFGLARRATIGAVSGLLLGLIVLGLASPPLPQPLAFWTSPILVEFVLGMWLGLARSEGFTLPLPVRIGLFGAGLCAFWLMGGEIPARAQFGGALLLALSGACLVAACGLAPGRPADRPPGTGLGRRLTHLGENLGDASYAIYLLHPFAIRGTLWVLDSLHFRPGLVILTLAGLAATFAIALLSHRLVERPLMRLVRRWMGASARVADAQ